MPTNARPAEKIIHVIGSDSEHHLRVAVETAAYQAGMQCLSVRGLAAFAAHCGTAVRSGSLQDQLAGLEAALDMMTQKRLEPCVLHLYDLDEELSQADDELRHDQENRFWARLIEALQTSSRRGFDTGRNDSRYTPPLIVILSTRSPLEQGPWMERLVFDSIRLDTPDRDYSRYLWSNDDVLENDAAIDLIKGRSARDILWLREKVQNQHTIENEVSPSSIVTLRQLCEELDTIRRKSSTLVRISNVRWEDVGGLVTVRQEIMDAIELPLKHPHLFPKGGGRSGILLYGT
jgi:SpoVK/Ycf46/Vps4 family AAA+-type ATPase